MKTRGLVWLGATLILIGCATTGNGGDVEGIEDDHAPSKNANNPTKGLSSGQGGSGQGAQGGLGGQGAEGGFGGAVGGGGSGGGGDNCNTVCAGKQAQCTDSGLDCTSFCDGATANDIACLSGISCALIYTCTGQPPGGGGAGGVGGGSGGVGGGLGGVGGGGTCSYPDCAGCADTCTTCLCIYQGNSANCTSYCG